METYCSLFTACWLGSISNHHHARAWERGWFQQTLPGLLSGNFDAQVRRKDQHFFFTRTIWSGSLGMHSCSHPCGGHHDLPAQAHPGSALPEQYSRSSTTYRFHFASECYLDCLRCFCATRWVIEFVLVNDNIQKQQLHILNSICHNKESRHCRFLFHSDCMKTCLYLAFSGISVKPTSQTVLNVKPDMK